MSRIEKEIVVDAPLSRVYDQWTQFESFPHFMEGVESVAQETDKTLRWTADVGGQRRSWTADIVDQTPDQRIAWRSTSGARNDGAVLFEPNGPDRTTIHLTVDVDPDGLVEQVGDALGFVDRRVGGDLDRFKSFIEERGVATGAWRGEIHGDDVRDDPSTTDATIETPTSTTRR